MFHSVLCLPSHATEASNHCKDRKMLFKMYTDKYRCHFIPVYPPPLLPLLASAAAAAETPGSLLARFPTTHSQRTCKNAR